MCYRVWQDGRFITIDEPHELADKVLKSVTYYQDEMKRAKEEAAKTRKEVAAEIVNEYAAENAALKEELNFTIASVASEKELDAYIAFTEKHLPCRNTRATGGKCPWIMQTSTGLGMVTKLKCPVCGETTDITDSSVW